MFLLPPSLYHSEVNVGILSYDHVHVVSFIINFHCRVPVIVNFAILLAAEVIIIATTIAMPVNLIDIIAAVVELT